DPSRLGDWPARALPGEPGHRLVRAQARAPRSSSRRGQVGGGVRSRPEEVPPFFLDPCQRVGDLGEAVMQFEARGTQRGMAIIGERAAYCQTVAAHRLGLLVLAFL